VARKRKRAKKVKPKTNVEAAKAWVEQYTGRDAVRDVLHVDEEVVEAINKIYEGPQELDDRNRAHSALLSTRKYVDRLISMCEEAILGCKEAILEKAEEADNEGTVLKGLQSLMGDNDDDDDSLLE